jgi:hypothetical protein
MKGLWKIVDFFRATRRRMRFGEFSRAPLRILRLEVRGRTAECEWLARPPDVWDRALPRHVGDSNHSVQALQDALKLRELLLAELPEIHSAVFRVFRQAPREPPELIITGIVTRDKVRKGISSLVMQAKLSGLRFSLDDGRLQALRLEERETRWDNFPLLRNPWVRQLVEH